MWRTMVALGSLTLAAAACSDTIMTPQVEPQFEFVIWDVWGGGSALEEVPYLPGLPQWNGENPRYQQVPGTTRFCPAWFAGVVLIEHFDGAFAVAGVFSKINNLSPTASGVPRAEYTVPQTEHYDMFNSGSWISGGSMKGKCYFIRINLGPNTGAWVGFFDVDTYLGTSGTGTGGGGGSPEGGWGYKNTSSGFQNGQGTGSTVEQVVNYYLQHGECKPGWDLYVDDALVCVGF